MNVRPEVRLAKYRAIDVRLRLRVLPSANRMGVRSESERWIRSFLDPYRGGVGGCGWPFGGTLFAEDFGRLIADLPDVRHVMGVELFELTGGAAALHPGWVHGGGVARVCLVDADLFVVRHVLVDVLGSGS